MNKPNARRLPWLFATLLLSSCATAPQEKAAVRVGIIGGMMRSGLWPELAKRFEVESGYQVEVALTGNRDLLAEAFRAGQVDLVTMSAGEIATELVAEGYARNPRVWTRNEFVLIGPHSDPAGIRGLRDGSSALARIGHARARFVNYQNSGPREVTTALWQKAGIRPSGDWVLQTESSSSEEALEFALNQQAYLVLGRVPKLPAGLEILVQGDAEMQRSFVLLEANPKRFPQANVQGARALADYCRSASAQTFLLAFGTNVATGIPLFYPVKKR